MKIGLLLDDTLDSTDGVQQYVLTLGSWLSSHGHEVHYLVGQSERSDLKNLHSIARVFRVKFNGNRLGTPLPSSKKQINDLINKLQLDVVHVQMPHSPFAAGKFINALGDDVVVVGSLHVLPANYITDLGTKIMKISIRKSLKRIDHIIANTSNTARYYKKTWGLDSHVIPNPIDSSILQAASRDRKKPNSKLKIAFLGRFVERKGPLNLIRGLALLSKPDKRKIHVEMAGKGPLFMKAKKLITRFKLQDIVTLNGFLPEADKPYFLANADIAIFPSFGGESFGISVAEPMAAGTPVVLAGHNKGYDAVLDGSPGLQFDANEPQAIANILSEWINASPDKIANTKTWLKTRSKDFDIKYVGPQIEKIYKIGRKNP